LTSFSKNKSGKNNPKAVTESKKTKIKHKNLSRAEKNSLEQLADSLPLPGR